MPTVTHITHGTYTADPIHCSFQAGVRHMGVGSFRASFSDVDARLTCDEDGSRLEGRAQVSSISISNPPEFREHVVNGEEFFDAANHPEISFASSRLDVGAGSAVELDGELVIKGIAKPLSATGTWVEPVEDPFGNLRAALDLEAVIDRRDWGLTWQAPLPNGGDALGWDVKLEINIEFIKDEGEAASALA
jgi:polyisoprenoid-binding protein YceI